MGCQASHPVPSSHAARHERQATGTSPCDGRPASALRAREPRSVGGCDARKTGHGRCSRIRPWTVATGDEYPCADSIGLSAYDEGGSPGCSQRRCPPHLPPSPATRRLSILQSPLRAGPRQTPRRPAHLAVVPPYPVTASPRPPAAGCAGPSPLVQI